MDKSLEFKKKFATKKGFTLFELVVVVAIMLIMVGVLFATKNSKKADTDVKAAARQVAAQIRSLQNEALTGKQISMRYASKFVFEVSGTTEYRTSYRDSVGEISFQTFDLGKKRVSIGIEPSAPLTFISPLGKIESNTKTSVVLTSTLENTAKMYVCVGSDGSVVEQITVCP